MANESRTASAMTAAEVVQDLNLSEEARSLLQQGQAARPFLDALLAKEQFVDAAKVMARAMPKREAVWWACQCVRKNQGDRLKPAALDVLKAAETWTSHPSDEHRRTTFSLVERCGSDNPAGMIGAAVYFSSGSLAPVGTPPVPPKDHLTAVMVGTAIVICAYQPAAKSKEHFEAFFALGLEVAHGKNRWKEGM